MPSYTYEALYLVIGLPSATSLGYTGVTDARPDTFDFLSDSIILADDNTGSAGYLPAVPALKAGGQFMDTPLQDGRVLVAASNDSITETLTLTAIGELGARQTALNALLDIIRGLHDFEVSNGITGKMVSLAAQFMGSDTPQFARVRKMELATATDFLNPSQTAASGITLTIERDPYWQDIPPGANPKIYAFLTRGLKNSSAPGAPATNFYNHTNLSLSATGGAANYQHFIEASILNFDETSFAAVNYVDIPAESIPGDAPALALIRYGQDVGAADAKPRFWVARSTIVDLYPSTNDNSTTQRMRNTFSGADASIVSLGGITASIQNDATNGLRSAAGGATRKIARLVAAAGGSSSSPGGISWSRANTYTRQWNVFFRMRITAGTPANCTMYFRVNQQGGLNGQVSIQKSLAGFAASANWFSFFVGRVSLEGLANRDIAGLGSIGNLLTFRVAVSKPNDGVAATIEIGDVLLMPLDEPCVQVDSLTPTDPLANFFTAYVDSTGYLYPNRQQASVGVVSSNPVALPTYGQLITLIPKVNNRLYFASQPINGTLDPARTFPVTVDIVPRWGAPRRAIWEE